MAIALCDNGAAVQSALQQTFAQYIKPGLVQERDTVESAGGFRL
jgi:hypothetical protein